MIETEQCSAFPPRFEVKAQRRSDPFLPIAVAAPANGFSRRQLRNLHFENDRAVEKSKCGDASNSRLGLAIWSPPSFEPLFSGQGFKDFFRRCFNCDFMMHLCHNDLLRFDE